MSTSSFSPAPSRAYLATLRLPDPCFSAPAPSEALVPAWSALARGDARTAAASCRQLLDASTPSGDERSATLTALAAALFLLDRHAEAAAAAADALALRPGSWIALRLLVNVQLAKGQIGAAQGALTAFVPDETPAPWDEPLAPRDFALLRATVMWQAQGWDDVRAALRSAFPAGVEEMPEPLQQDAFRLALYRGDSDEAAEAARALLTHSSVEAADDVLQTLVQQGWVAQALPLYRSLYDEHGGGELLRRRLVGLCIREGRVAEARTLVERGPLQLAV